MKNFSLAGLCLLCATGLAAAEDEPDMEQFARGYQLQTDAGAAIYQLTLPESVYQTTVRSDLGDVRVFNQDRQRVPHAIRKPEPIHEADIREVPFFPIVGFTQKDNQRFRSGELDITIADDGTLIRIKPRASAASPMEVRRYLIDLSSMAESIDELEFELSGSRKGYVKRALLKHSNDLNNWTTLIPNFTLTELDYADHSLKKTKVKLPDRKLKYLMFNWKGDSNGLQIQSVRAILDTVQSSHQRQWSVVDSRQPDDDMQIHEFDSGGLFPVDRIDVILPEDNTLIDAVISSRPNEESDWRRRYEGLFYNLQVKGNHIERGEVSVRSSNDRYWQLLVKTKDGLGSEQPSLRFGWIPNELYFLARGEGPFNLVFGNGQIEAPVQPVAALMNVLSDDEESDLIGQATLGQELSLMGNAALQAELQIPWQRILLWGLLVLGVSILGTMAVRLFRQLR